MADNAASPLGSTEHHEPLLMKVGDWQVSCKYFMDPAGEPELAEGTDHVESLGQTWTVGRFQAKVLTTPIHGLATSGYDPRKEKYVATWQDSATPYLYYFEGGFSEDGLLELEGENRDPVTGKLVKYRSIEKIEQDRRKLQLFIVPEEGDPIAILEYDYTRA